MSGHKNLHDKLGNQQGKHPAVKELENQGYTLKYSGDSLHNYTHPKLGHTIHVRGTLSKPESLDIDEYRSGQGNVREEFDPTPSSVHQIMKSRQKYNEED